MENVTDIRFDEMERNFTPEIEAARLNKSWRSRGKAHLKLSERSARVTQLPLILDRFLSGGGYRVTGYSS